VTVTRGQDSGIVQQRGIDAPAGRAGRAFTGAVAGLLALAAYVETFVFAGNGCWLDVAAAVGASAIVGYGTLFSMLRLTRGVRTPNTGRRNERAAGVFTQGILAAAAVLVCAAGLNVLLYEVTGLQTLGARVVALLFVPLHCGLLIVADLTALLAIASAAHTTGLPRARAAWTWVLWLNLPVAATFILLRSSGSI
jgi:hypothetical protein